MPLMPKRVKYRKVSKGSRAGYATSGTELAYGEFGLKALTRGLLATVYMTAADGVTANDVQDAYERRYANEALVSTLPAGRMPQTSSVAATARAQVGVALDDRRRRVIIASCAIDNLGKGAAAQAMQCANLVLGLPETQGIGATAPLI